MQHPSIEFLHDEDTLAGIEVLSEEDKGEANEEVKNVVQYMKTRKAPYVDDITSEVIKAGDINMVSPTWNNQQVLERRGSIY